MITPVARVLTGHEMKMLYVFHSVLREIQQCAEAILPI